MDHLAPASKTVAIMQPYFFPYLGYFQLLHAADTFVLLDNVQMITRGWVHRNRILLAGEPHFLGVPLQNKTQRQLICETKISASPWQENFLKTLHHAYCRAPFYSTVIEVIQSVLASPGESIAALARQSIEKICQYLGEHRSLEWASAIPLADDVKGTARILQLCTYLNATHYVNLPGGKELYQQADFVLKKMDLKFLSPTLTPYKQFNNDFVSALSMIDVLMFNSVEEVLAKLQEYSFE